MRNVVQKNAFNLNLRISSAIGPHWLHTLVHVVVQMSMVQIIELNLDKLSHSQYLIVLLDMGVYNCAFTRRKVYFLIFLYCTFHN